MAELREKRHQQGTRTIEAKRQADYRTRKAKEVGVDALRATYTQQQADNRRRKREEAGMSPARVYVKSDSLTVEENKERKREKERIAKAKYRAKKAKTTQDK